MMRGEEVDAVVAPSAIAREFGNRHQLDVRDAELGQMVEAIDRRIEGSRRREGANMQLIHDRGIERRGIPAGVGPGEVGMIDDARAAVHAVRLRLRARIGQRRFSAVEDEGIIRRPPRRAESRPSTIRRPREPSRGGRRQARAEPGERRRPDTNNHEAEFSRARSWRASRQTGNRRHQFRQRDFAAVALTSPVSTLHQRPGGKAMTVSPQSPARPIGRRGATVIAPAPRQNAIAWIGATRRAPAAAGSRRRARTAAGCAAANPAPGE